MNKERQCKVKWLVKQAGLVDLIVAVNGSRDMTKNLDKATFQAFLRDAHISIGSPIDSWDVPIAEDVLKRYGLIE